MDKIKRTKHVIPKSRIFRFPTSITPKEERMIVLTNYLKSINIKLVYMLSVLFISFIIIAYCFIRIFTPIFIILILLVLLGNFIFLKLRNYSSRNIDDLLEHELSMTFISEIIPKVTVTVGDTGAGKDTFNNVLIHADVFRMIHEDLEYITKIQKLIYQVDFENLEILFFKQSTSKTKIMHEPIIMDRNKKIIIFLKENNFFLHEKYSKLDFYDEYVKYSIDPELKLHFGKFNGYSNTHYIDMLVEYIYCLNRLYVDTNKVWSNHPLIEPTGIMSKILSERNLNINDIDRVPLLPEKAVFVQTEISSIQGNQIDNITAIVKNTGRTQGVAYRRHVWGEDITWRAANQDPGRQVKIMRELEHSFIQIIAKIETPGDSSKIQSEIDQLKKEKYKTKSKIKEEKYKKKISSLIKQKEKYEYDFGMTEFIIHVSKTSTPVKSVKKLESLLSMLENKDYMLGKSYACKLRIRTAVAKGYHNPWYLSGLKDIMDTKTKLHYSNTPNWSTDMKLHTHHIKYMEQSTMKQLFGLNELNDVDRKKLNLPDWYSTGLTYKNIEKVKTADKQALNKILIQEQEDSNSPAKYLIKIITAIDKNYLLWNNEKFKIVKIYNATLFNTQKEANKVVNYFKEQIYNHDKKTADDIALKITVNKATKKEIIKVIENKNE